MHPAVKLEDTKINSQTKEIIFNVLYTLYPNKSTKQQTYSHQINKQINQSNQQIPIQQTTNQPNQKSQNQQTIKHQIPSSFLRDLPFKLWFMGRTSSLVKSSRFVFALLG